MSHATEPVNGGESPLASGMKASDKVSRAQVESHAPAVPAPGELDGGPAPSHVGDQIQSHTVDASQDESGVAPAGGLVTSAGSAKG